MNTIKLAVMTAGRQIVLLGGGGKWFEEYSQFTIDTRSRRRGMLAIIQDGVVIGVVTSENEAAMRAANDGGHLALGYVDGSEILIHKVSADWIDYTPRSRE